MHAFCETKLHSYGLFMHFLIVLMIIRYISSDRIVLEVDNNIIVIIYAKRYHTEKT